MTKQEIYALAEQYQKKANRAYYNYQETGIGRYDRERQKNEDLADSLRMAAMASDEHMKLVSIRASLALLARKAEDAANDLEKLQNLRSELLSEARLYGVFKQEVTKDLEPGEL